MASKSFYEDFRGAGDLDATKPLVTDGVNTGGSFFWTTTETYGDTGGAVVDFSNYFQRTGSGATILAPGVGGVRVARLRTHFDILHSAAVSVFEASVLPEFGFRIFFDFADNYLHLECGAGGSGRWMRDVGGSLSSGTFSTTAPGAWVVLRIEVTNSQTRYYVDDSLVHTIGSGFSYGFNTGPFLLGIPRTLTAHGYTAGSTLAALNYLHVKTETVSGQLGGASAGDTEPPVFAGTLTLHSKSPTGFGVAYLPATDDTVLAGYEYSLDSGATWTSVGNLTTFNISNLTPGTAYVVLVRAVDDAGNRSTPPIAAATTLSVEAAVTAMFDTFVGRELLHNTPPWYADGTGAKWDVNGITPYNPSHRDPARHFYRTVEGGAQLQNLAVGQQANYISLEVKGLNLRPSAKRVVVEFQGRGAWNVAVMANDGPHPNNYGYFSGEYGSFGPLEDTTAYPPYVSGGVAGAVAGPGLPLAFTKGALVTLQTGYGNPGQQELPQTAAPGFDRFALHTYRLELSTTGIQVFIDGTLFGSLTTNWAALHPVRMISLVPIFGSDPIYLVARSNTDSGPIGKPEALFVDPADPPPPPPPEPPGPNNEPPTGEYALFWTEFQATYEVP